MINNNLIIQEPCLYLFIYLFIYLFWGRGVALLLCCNHCFMKYFDVFIFEVNISLYNIRFQDRKASDYSFSISNTFY